MEWIKITDKLPPELDEVIIYRGNRKVTTAFFEFGNWRLFNDYFADDVTHWMPLPAPPNPNLDFLTNQAQDLNLGY